MNLLCPNCQKMLTVPEEFAGQLMRCPLCNGNFTVPGLPSSVPLAPPSSPPESEIYSIRHEPAPPPSFSPPPPLQPLEPSVPPSTATTTTPPPSKPSLAPEDYQHTLTGWLSPRVLPWIAPVCLLLVFFLQIIPSWVGLYPGGIEAMWGNAWSAAFGAYTPDNDLKKEVPFIADDKHKPGWSLLTFFYLLLFFPVLVVTIASVVLPMIHVKLPPQVEKLLPWRWGIVAASNLILFLFLGLQVLLGFSLESHYRHWVDNQIKQEIKDNPTSEERKTVEAHRGELLDMLHHTIWLRLVVLLHLVAIVSSALMFWLNQRGTHRPLPKFELRW